MWKSLERIAAALEAQNKHTDGSEAFMASAVENQKRMIAQAEEDAQAREKHRADCDKYHKDMISQINTSLEDWRTKIASLEERIAALEQKSEPWT
jgi:chromosome segregation ATPase